MVIIWAVNSSSKYLVSVSEVTWGLKGGLSCMTAKGGWHWSADPGPPGAPQSATAGGMACHSRPGFLANGEGGLGKNTPRLSTPCLGPGYWRKSSEHPGYGSGRCTGKTPVTGMAGLVWLEVG